MNVFVVEQKNKQSVKKEKTNVYLFTQPSFFHIFQWLVCLAYLLPAFATGLAMTFSVTGLPHYQDDSGQQQLLKLDENQSSWFGMLSEKGSIYILHDVLPYEMTKLLTIRDTY